MAVLDIFFASNALKRKTSMKAIIPADPYDTDTGTAPEYDEFCNPMRSLYLLHGYGGDCNDWIDNTDIQRLAKNHRIAVFLPSGENSFYVDSAMRGDWESFIVDELVPFTRRMFNVSHDAANTFIAGNSMGGFGALNLGLGHPEIFGKAAALSSALILDTINGIEPGYRDLIADYDYYRSVFDDLTKIAGGPNDPRERMRMAVHEGTMQPLYLACGSEDFLIERNRAFVALARELGVDVVYEEHSGVHDWTFWNQHITTAIEWMDDKERNR
ncbi:alpha/beta hydrolase [Bifidobacterium dentium]|uniref:alpha/beta hydrolase n=1 Tax=Bifidobacterium dentium TaxID=1689 RepID=UPI0026DBD760|nr:alpha/beta hydrolase family protein [Bifidobacterium dentium]